MHVMRILGISANYHDSVAALLVELYGMLPIQGGVHLNAEATWRFRALAREYDVEKALMSLDVAERLTGEMGEKSQKLQLVARAIGRLVGRKT